MCEWHIGTFETPGGTLLQFLYVGLESVGLKLHLSSKDCFCSMRRADRPWREQTCSRWPQEFAEVQACSCSLSTRKGRSHWFCPRFYLAGRLNRFVFKKQPI